ncbi:MAG: sensor histidine kinase [Lepagella sp.]
MKSKTLKAGLGWAVGIVGYYLWFQAFYNAVRFGEVFPYTDAADMMAAMAHNFTPVLSVFLLNLLIVFKIVRIKSQLLKIFVDVVLSIFAACLVNWAYLIIIGAFRKAGVDWAGSILNDIIVLLGVEMVYYFKRLSKAREEVEKTRLQALQYRYDALKAQINPHFLFNSLNLLYSLISIDAIRSKQFILELSRMYRYIMIHQNDDRVSVEEEFKFLESYISVLKMRYNNKFEVVMTGVPESDKQIVPFTMQLLIENVTKHNAITSKSPMTVTIDITPDGITITNPLNPKESESSGHVGLTYLSQLYKAHGREFSARKGVNEFVARIQYL